MSDHDTLIALNLDYVNSVQRSDTRRFDEILSDDFLNTNPPDAWPSWMIMSTQMHDQMSHDQKNRYTLLGIYKALNTGSAKSNSDIFVLKKI